MGNSPPTMQLAPSADRATISDKETVVNDDYEMSLMGLLANLEYQRHRIEIEGARRETDKTLERAGHMVEALVKFSNDQKISDTSLAMREAANQVGLFFGALSPVTDLNEAEPGGLRRWLGFGKKPTPAEPKREQTLRCLDSLCEATLQFFIAFTERFADSKSARPWVETAAGFLADLKRAGREAPV
jgi:hypothetical protein